MSTGDSEQVSEWLREGIAAARAGRRGEARELLTRVVEANENSEQGWIWLSGVVDTDEDRLICLENVLTLDPDNAQARAGLKWLKEKGVGSRDFVVSGFGRAQSRPQSNEQGLGSEERKADFLTPEGCVYCGLAVGDDEKRCPHCNKLLVSRQFKYKERSGWVYKFHAFWLILSITIIIEALMIRFDWTKFTDFVSDKSPKSLAPIVDGPLYDIASALVHPEMTGDTSPEATVIFMVLLGLGGAGLLLVPALFLRPGLAQVASWFLTVFCLMFIVVLLARGTAGLGLVTLQGIYTIRLAMFVYEDVDNFALVERRERLKFDRHAVNATDFYGRGRAYEKRGQWARALLHWRQAAALSPANAAYPAAMARACARLGRLEMALEYVNQALEISPNQDLRRLRESIVEMQQEQGET